MEKKSNFKMILSIIISILSGIGSAIIIITVLLTNGILNPEFVGSLTGGVYFEILVDGGMIESDSEYLEDIVGKSVRNIKNIISSREGSYVKINKPNKEGRYEGGIYEINGDEIIKLYVNKNFVVDCAIVNKSIESYKETDLESALKKFNKRRQNLIEKEMYLENIVEDNFLYEYCYNSHENLGYSGENLKYDLENKNIANIIYSYKGEDGYLFLQEYGKRLLNELGLSVEEEYLESEEESMEEEYLESEEIGLEEEDLIKLINQKMLENEGYEIENLELQREYIAGKSDDLPEGRYIIVVDIDGEGMWYVNQNTLEIYYSYNTEGGIKLLE